MGDGQVERCGDLGERVEGWNGVAVLNSGEVAAQEAGFLFDVALREAFLQAEGANRGANFHAGVQSVACRGYFSDSNRISIVLIVNTATAWLASGILSTAVTFGLRQNPSRCTQLHARQVSFSLRK